MLSSNCDDEVFEWLGEGLSPSLPYLQLLHPNQSERGRRVLANLRVVVSRLRNRPEYWRELIRAQNWRHTIIGCSAVLMVREARFLDDLLYRFDQGSWVAPQLAIALGLVHPAEAVTELEGVIRQHDSSADFKRVFSAYAVLKLMGREIVQEFEASDLFRRSQIESTGTSLLAQDSLVAVNVVHSQWDFWTSQDVP